ncbi:uncharacterized protein LOC131955550 [Physella acuta]|uniref:uncharacterized protein LOC131955550 n=1 Tax=Physella acuta TaxID=109671 RepID=UPI0027DB1213|nr:uncharacterized protein LOC131955550 [Physella acuta]XP_059175691.1 uncharacterized protein LOC131955550 [Physella acuta]
MATDQRYVKLGQRIVPFPSDVLQVMDSCNHLLDDVGALHQEMTDKGYLLIRGFHDRQEVLAAREAVLKYIDSLGGKLDSDHPFNDGVLKEGCGLGCLPVMEGRNEISHKDSVLRVLEGTRPFAFFKKYFNEDVKTFDYKWLRAMHHEGFTGAHVDNVYMSRGSKDLLTMWTPIGDVSIEMGVLAVCEGSNSLPSFSRMQSTYGEMDAELIGLKGTGWLTEDPFEITEKFGGQWKTTDFRAGDVLIFNMRTVHMSTTNTTQYARLSCDTRWQPASHPCDPRFNGDFEKPKGKFGLLSKLDTATIQSYTTIEGLKEKWGI